MTALRRLDLRTFGLVVAWLALSGALVAAQDVDPQRAFYRGNDLFGQGDFAGAAAAWEEAIAAGHGSAALHFNLANACLRLKQPGRAIYHYRLAQRFAPRDPDVAANLRLAYERAAIAPPEESRGLARALLFVHERLTPSEAFVGFAALWLLGFGLLHLRALRGRPRGLVLPGICLVLGAAVAFSLLARHEGWFADREAIVVSPTAVAWSGPSEEKFGKLFEVPEGTALIVISEEGDWVRVAAGSLDRQGLVRRSSLALL
ncbi:MAG: tetratricopeptide repeat protein [Planctomycetota bacterium]